jgi:hypothetical protein
MFYFLLAISNLPATIILSCKRFNRYRKIAFGAYSITLAVAFFGLFQDRYVFCYQISSTINSEEGRREFCLNGIRDFRSKSTFNRLFVESDVLITCRDAEKLR